MNWIDKRSQTNEFVRIGSFKISHFLFAYDLVLLADSEFGLQRALDKFAAVCNTAEMKISTTKTEVLHLVFFANGRSSTETGGEVQVCWGRIHE